MKWPDASTTEAWPKLVAASESMRRTSVQDLVRADPDRGRWACVEADGFILDFSRQRLDRSILRSLCELADQLTLRERIEAMFRGDTINETEHRAVLHTALRRPSAPFAREVAAEREHMLAFAEGVRAGSVKGSSGSAFERVVNIGIGGSDLGPSMAVQSLLPFTKGAPRVDFVSNVGGCALADLLEAADPAKTLFIVCSKTFTTSETLSNARTARRWIERHLGERSVPQHFAAVSVNVSAMDAFGVHPQYRFALWDWVGGRYSLWSSIGVSLAIAIGAPHYRAMLSGAARMDEHFRTANWQHNLPALMGLLGVWNINGLDLPTVAVLPYDERLARLPAYLQQLDMESNGKSVRHDGSATFCATAPVVWGEPGNNAQHSFFQMLHQGTPRAALEFLLPALSSCGDADAHRLSIANCLAQAEAFAYGQPAEAIHASVDLVPHKVHSGGRPSSLLMFRQLDPPTLGGLIALYEHKVFTQSVVWGINAFDQWGVELGKGLAQAILPLLDGSSGQAGATLSLSLGALSRLLRA